MRYWPSLCLAACVVLSSARGQDAPSQLFRLEGHGLRTGWLFPDDEVRRVTALHDVVTPHVVWAKPMRGGPLRVLAIAPKTDGRWPVELAQRFDLSVKTIYCHDAGRLGAEPERCLYVQKSLAVEARLLQALNEALDVIVSNVPFPVLGERVGRRLEELVGSGVGYVGPVEGSQLADLPRDEAAEARLVGTSVPVSGLRLLSAKYGSAERAAGEIVRAYRDRDCRAVDPTGYPRDGEKPPPNRLRYRWLPSMEQEAWCALMGRAIAWAAGRANDAAEALVALPSDAIPRRRLPMDLPSTVDRQSLVLRIWDSDGRLRHEARGTRLPRLPAGQYFFGMQRLDSGAVAGWSFSAFRVHGDARIAAVEVDSPYKRPGDSVRAVVRLAGTPPAESVLHFEVIDNWGRCISQERKKAGGEVTFDGALDESLHIYNYANVRLIGPGGDVLDEERTAFYLARPSPPTDDLSLMVWEGCVGFDPFSQLVLGRFAELGFDAALNSLPKGSTETRVSEALAMENIQAIHYVTRVGPAKVGEDGIRRPCINSPSRLNWLKGNLEKQAKAFRPFGPMAYSLGDDQRYLRPGEDACWSDSCRALFADWTKRRYGEINRVNDAWGTGYGGFEEVEPIKKADALAAARAAEPRFGPLCHWVDHQLFLDTMLADWHRNMAEVVAKVDAQPVTWYDCSVEGWLRPGSAFDFWQLASKSRFCVQYPNPMVHDIYRCAAARDAYHGTWYGGYGIYNYAPYRDAEFLPWWSVFRGINLHGLYYGGNSSKWFHDRLLGPDLGCMDGVEKIMRNINELRGGIAKLIFNSERLHDKVAVVYSTPSVHLTALLEGGLPMAPEWGVQATGSHSYVYMQCWEALAALLRDVGLSFDVFPASALAEGRISTDEYRLLVMPLNLRVSDAEAKAVRRFVADGGILLADALLGRFDGAARPVAHGVLADVLGVRSREGVPGPGIERQSAAMRDGMSLGVLTVEKTIETAGAEAAGAAVGGTPVLLVNTFGKGRSIYLNTLARDYQIWRTLGAEIPFRDALAGLIAEGGVTAPVSCDVGFSRKGDKHRAQATEVNRYRLGGAEFVGILRHAKLRPDDAIFLADLRPKPVRIGFGKTAHVYDVRNRTYRGLTDRIEDVLYAGRAELYALMPYEVRGLKLKCEVSNGVMIVSGSIVPDGDGVELTTHVFHFEVTGPSGRIQPELRRNVVCEKGVFRERIFLGYNASPGAWKVTVLDVASGMQRTIRSAGQPSD